MKQYCIPSLTSFDSSKLHLFRNQSTCVPGSLTLDDSFCGAGNPGDNQVAICLTQNVDPSLLDGLIVNTDDGSSFVMSGCVSDVSGFCNNFGYICTTSGAYPFQVNLCLSNLVCSDGITIIDNCNDGNTSCTLD